jgi:Nif-specific regulatory protein
MSDHPGILSTEHILIVGQKLLELRPLDDVLRAVIEAAAEALNAETAMILLRERDKMEIAAQQSKSGEPRGLDSISASLLDDALAKREPLLSESAVQDPRFSGRSSIMIQGIQAIAIIPLVSQNEAIGAIYLDSRSDRTRFSTQNLAPLNTLAAFCTLAINNARRYERARREIQTLKSQKTGGRGAMVGSSPAMTELFAMIERVAHSDLPVLLTGESGTGKELVAREIHTSSARAERPFLALYCGNVAPQLFESELFGHKKGAFTGAGMDKLGLVEAARGGTLFLDEVADIPADLQTKLLRFLQEGEYRAVGDTKTFKADVRVVTASNKDLKREADEGRFRSDLYYRLYILPIHTPPLRERLSDLPYLVKHFIEKYSKNGQAPGVSPEALKKMLAHTWPGNIRELENAIARAMVVCKGDRIEPEDIIVQESMTRNPDDLSWKAAEQAHILHVLSVCAGNKSRAAEMLGISRRYLHYKLKEWGEG